MFVSSFNPKCVHPVYVCGQIFTLICKKGLWIGLKINYRGDGDSIVYFEGEQPLQFTGHLYIWVRWLILALHPSQVCYSGGTVCFIYTDYNFLYLQNQTKLTRQRKLSALHNIKAVTLLYILLWFYSMSMIFFPL